MASRSKDFRDQVYDQEFLISDYPTPLPFGDMALVVLTHDDQGEVTEHYFYEKRDFYEQERATKRVLFHRIRKDGRLVDAASRIAERMRGRKQDAEGTYHPDVQHAIQASVAVGKDRNGRNVLHVVYLQHLNEFDDHTEQENTQLCYKQAREAEGWFWPEEEQKISGSWHDWDNQECGGRHSRGRPAIYHIMHPQIIADDAGAVVVTWSQHPRIRPCGEIHAVFVAINTDYGNEGGWRTDPWRCRLGDQIMPICDLPGSHCRVTPVEIVPHFQKGDRVWGRFHWRPRIHRRANGDLDLAFIRRDELNNTNAARNIARTIHYLRYSAAEDVWDYQMPESTDDLGSVEALEWLFDSLVYGHGYPRDSVGNNLGLELSVRSEDVVILFTQQDHERPMYHSWYHTKEVGGGWTGPELVLPASDTIPNPSMVRDHRGGILVFGFLKGSREFVYRCHGPDGNWRPALADPPAVLYRPDEVAALEITKVDSLACQATGTDFIFCYNKKLKTAAEHGGLKVQRSQVYGMVKRMSEVLYPETVTSTFLTMPGVEFSLNDECGLSAWLFNPTGDTLRDVSLGVLLRISGSTYYWTHENWTPEATAGWTGDVPPGFLEIPVIDRFDFPGANGASMHNIVFRALMFSGNSQIGGEGRWVFAYV